MPKPQPRPAKNSTSRTLDLGEKSLGSRPKKRRVPAQNPSIPHHPANDAGVQRRARKRAEAKRKNWLTLGVFSVLTTMIGGAAFGAYSGYKGPYWRLQDMKQSVASKTETLQILQKQLGQKQRQLASLNSPTGRERVLVEQGYIKEGERILLFPKEKSQ